MLATELAERAASRFGAEIWNTYGPTECAIDALAWRHRREQPAGPSVPLGRPLPNLTAYVLAPGGEPAPIGVPGELFLGGRGLGVGYWDRPDLTAERFVPARPDSRAVGEPGGRWYRTGDRARLLASGAVEFLGRLDAQVKIRGHRIEPAEIEAAFASLPEVAAVAVVATGAGLAVRLVAFCTLRPGEAFHPEPARRRLAERLPEALIPISFVVLDELPEMANGKLDRRRLGDLAAAHAEAGEPGAEAPRGPVEELVATAFGDLLDRRQVGRSESFFALGGHSLLAVRLISRLKRALGVELPLSQVFEEPTVAGLARLAAERRAARASGDAGTLPVDRSERIGRRDRDAPLPLSPAQRRLWFLDRLDPEGSAYNLPAAVRLRGALDGPALAASLAEVVRRHEALRTAFPESAGRPVQRVAPPGGWHFPTISLAALPETARRTEESRVAALIARRRFDLATGPLLRSTLLRISGDESLLLLVVHHIVADAWSMTLLTREVAVLYPAIALGRPALLPDLPIQYGDFAAWQSEAARSREDGPAIERWRRRLAGVPTVVSLLTDRPRPAEPDPRGGRARLVVAEAQAAGMRALVGRHGATPFMGYFAVFQLLLRHFSRHDELLIGYPIAGRDRIETEDLIGFFANVLVLRSSCAGAVRFCDLVERTRESVLAAFDDREVPFERLVDELQAERDPSHSPLVQLAFTLNEAPRRGELGAGLRFEVEPIDLEGAQFELVLGLSESEGEVHGSLQFSAALWHRSTIVRWAEHYRWLVEQVVAEPEIAIAECLERLAARDRSLRDAKSARQRQDLGGKLRSSRRDAVVLGAPPSSLSPRLRGDEEERREP
jgi:acyl carrier protein